MAVNLVTPASYGYDIAALVGVNTALLTQAKSAGVLITNSSTGSLAVKVGSHTYGVIPFKGQAATMLKEGKMGPASKESVKYQLEKAIATALGDADKPVQANQGLATLMDSLIEDTPALTQGQKAALTKKLKKEAAKTAEPQATIFQKPAVPVGANLPQVKLAEATALYQPVYGTSGGSVYYAVAFFNDLKIAIRRNNSSLSVRAEGNVKGHSAALATVGFSVKGDYASVHLDVKDDELLTKTFGAIVGAVGFDKLVSAANPLEAK